MKENVERAEFGAPEQAGQALPAYALTRTRRPFYALTTFFRALLTALRVSMTSLAFRTIQG